MSRIHRIWRSWDFPTKIGVVSGVLGVIGFPLAIIPVLGGSAELPFFPGGSGWVLLGDFDQTEDRYIRGPFYEIEESNYSVTSFLPRKGEVLRTTVDRSLIIVDFKTLGTTQLFQPPWRENVLEEGDYTGVLIPAGSIVEVRDVSLGRFPGMPFVVWVRIASPPDD